MKTVSILLLILILLLPAAGCVTPGELPEPEDPQEPQEPADPGEPQKPEDPAGPVEPWVPALEGLRRGDSVDMVKSLLGDSYRREAFDDDIFTFGEPFLKLHYEDRGITVVAGQDTGTVFEVLTTSPDTVTNLGFRVGDPAGEVLEDYRQRYSEALSNQDDSVLTGWFLVDGQDLVIINYGQSDSLGNPPLTPEARVERIILTSMDYMD